MTKPAKVTMLAAIALLAFFAGAWYNGRSPSVAADGRHAVRYICPMHPQYTSDRPGVAPCCGMRLVAVSGDPAPSAAVDGVPMLPPGAIRVSSEKQQSIGVRIGAAELTAGPQTWRVLGRVAADERLVYKINATVDGWIRDTSWNVTTGALVRKHETLASFYAAEFLSAQQAYLFSLGALDRFHEAGKDTEAQMRITRANIQQAKDSLVTLGMSQLQADEISKTRQVTQDIRIIAPANGFILARNVSPGQRFEKGAEFFRIADLSRVWVVADLFENEARLITQGQAATVKYQGRTWHARLSNVLPQFDPQTRTLTTRFELDNLGFALRPGMFVDVELQVNAAPAVTVPADAVIDSGRRQTVYVERDGGFFEPRAVGTGWRLGDRVQITRGLEAGARVVVSGNFLLDSESRMQLAATSAGAAPAKPVGGGAARAQSLPHPRTDRGMAAAGPPANPSQALQLSAAEAAAETDPVCGMHARKGPGAIQVRHGGKTYYFCSGQCKEKFEAAPEKYVSKKQPARETARGMLVPAVLRGARRQRAWRDDVEEMLDMIGVRLTPREAETLEGLLEGLSNQQIAEKMGIRASTVRTFIRVLNVKIGAPKLRTLRQSASGDLGAATTPSRRLS